MPWAWGINGCASVLSAILASLLAIEIGFNGVMLVAVVLHRMVKSFNGVRILRFSFLSAYPP